VDSLSEEKPQSLKRNKNREGNIRGMMIAFGGLAV